MRSLLIAAAVAAAASLAGVAQSTASAAPPVAVEIRATLTFVPIRSCIWEASGGIDDAGLCERTEGRTAPPDRPFGVPGPFKEVFVFTGSKGTFTIKAEELDTGTEVVGPWQIVSGTGAYEGASGHGTVAFSGPPFVFTLTGVVSKVDEA